MPIQAISNSQSRNQNFTGRVQIMNDLSYLPCKQLRKALPQLEDFMESKPYDLFVTQEHKNKLISFVVKKEEDIFRHNSPFAETLVPTDKVDEGDLYLSAVKRIAKRYEELPNTSFLHKCKTFFNNLLGKN